MTRRVATMQEVLVHVRKGAGVDVDKVQTAIRPMIDSVLRNQDAMAWLVYLRKRDEYSYHHSIASSVWAVILGRHLGFDRQGLDTLAMGGMLLDIGKAKLPESIINREGKLSPAEYEAVKKHVELRPRDGQADAGHQCRRAGDDRGPPRALLTAPATRRG